MTEPKYALLGTALMKAANGERAAYYSYDLVARENAWNRAKQLAAWIPVATVDADNRWIRFPNGGRIEFVISAADA